MIREIDTSSWRLDSYHQFDGTISQSFQSTSMHLSFTDYHVPIVDGERGSYDNQVFFLESIISVQDRGEWVADVDPLPLMRYDEHRGSSFKKLGMPITNTAWPKGQASCQHKINSYSDQDITAVDTWNELLDAPEGMFVVRAGDNWVSRLAATLIAHQRMTQDLPKSKITVCPPQVCWTCVKAKAKTRAFIF